MSSRMQDRPDRAPPHWLNPLVMTSGVHFAAAFVAAISILSSSALRAAFVSA
jgi:hypothetical protein